MIENIFIIVAGVVAAAPMIIKKLPDAEAIIEKIRPYSGWIGVLLLAFSVFDIFSLLGSFNIISLVRIAASFVVGFLLAYGILKEKLFNKDNPEAKEKGELIYNKIIQYQVPAGIALITIGLLNLLR